MPLPLALGGAVSAFGGLGKLTSAFGLSEQRLRTPAQNRAHRVKQIAEAMTMARQGDRLGVQLLLQWSGQLPHHTVRDARYAGGTPQGRMPADGVEGALAALATLRSEGTLVGTKLYKGKASEDVEGARQGVRSAAKEKAFAEAFMEDVVTGSGRSAPRRTGGASERTYTRYDPETGRKYKVTQDDPRYDEWPSRKPSQRALRAAGGSGSAARGRKAKRYDPDTGRAVSVYPDDPRYDEWPSRKPTRRTTRASASARRTLETRIRNAGLRASSSLVTRFASLAAAAGMTTGAAAATVVAAGVASYAATSAVMAMLERARDPAVKRQQIALAYRDARKRLAAKQGRTLDTTEQRMLAEWFRSTMRAKGYGAYLGGTST